MMAVLIERINYNRVVLKKRCFTRQKWGIFWISPAVYTNFLQNEPM